MVYPGGKYFAINDSKTWEAFEGLCALSLSVLVKGTAAAAHIHKLRTENHPLTFCLRALAVRLFAGDKPKGLQRVFFSSSFRYSFLFYFLFFFRELCVFFLFLIEKTLSCHLPLLLLLLLGLEVKGK